MERINFLIYVKGLCKLFSYYSGVKQGQAEVIQKISRLQEKSHWSQTFSAQTHSM